MSIYNGYLALRDGVDFKWLLTFNEDQYVVVEHALEGLKTLNPNDPMVVAGIGCGRRWSYVNPGKPKPEGWNDKSTCEGVERHGGICGGFGIFVSRAAVDAFFQKGPSAFWESARPYLGKSKAQDDDSVACLTYDWKIPLRQWSYVVGRDLREPSFTKEKEMMSPQMASLYHLSDGNATRMYVLEKMYRESLS
jgi:hypothetical protein